MKKLKGVISVFALSLCLLSPAQAEEQRYISIRNTDMVWVPGNVCVWQFRLDNHPSGDPEPSQCDRNIMGRLKESLALVDVNILDHLVVGSDGIVSFAERGWI